MDAFEREVILAELKRSHSNVSLAAKSLGLERSHLYKKAEQLGIDLRAMRREQESQESVFGYEVNLTWSTSARNSVRETALIQRERSACLAARDCLFCLRSVFSLLFSFICYALRASRLLRLRMEFAWSRLGFR